MLEGATCLVMLLVSSASAAAPSARLVYLRDAGAEDCPDEGAVRAAVASRLGYDPFFPQARATLFAELKRKKSTYTARIKLVDEQNVVRGARELSHSGPHCADLIDTMALSISVAIDPKSLLDGRQPAEPQEVSASSEPLAVPPVAEATPVPTVTSQPARPASPPPDAPPPTPPAHTSMIVSIAGAGWGGAAPAPNVGVLGGIGLRFGRVDVMVEGRADLPAATEVRLGTVRTSFLGGTLVPCGRLGIVFGCGIATLGQLSAEARGLAIPRSDDALYSFVGLRLGVGVPMSSRIDLRVQSDVLYALTPRTLLIDGQSAYAMPRASVGIALGAAVRIF